MKVEFIYNYSYYMPTLRKYKNFYFLLDNGPCLGYRVEDGPYQWIHYNEVRAFRNYSFNFVIND